MEVKLHEISCCECQVTFWITDAHDDRLRNCHNGFYCPNGHRQCYEGKTEAEKAKEDRDRYSRWYKDSKETSERLTRSNSALRGVITRQKNKE